MNFSRLKRIIRETLEEQSHWHGVPGPGYNPPVGPNGQIIPGDYIYLNGQCEACDQGHPISYQCYGPNPPLIYTSLTECQNANAVQGCTNPQATNYDPSATQDDGSCLVPCLQPDFFYDASCGQQFLHEAPGGANSWNNWIQKQWNNFNTGMGCYHLGAIITYTNNQINPTTNCPALWNGYGGEKNNGQCHSVVQIRRKFGKIKWAECLKTGCGINSTQSGCGGGTMPSPNSPSK